MSDISDSDKLSSYVNGILDRKIKSLAISMGSVAALIRDQAFQTSKVKAFQMRFARGSNTFGNWETRPGVIEMWGRYARTGTEGTGSQPIVFPLILPNTTFNVSATPVISAADPNHDLWVQIIETSRSVSTVSMLYQSSNSAGQTLDGFDWRIICVVPFDYIASENTSALGTSIPDSSGTQRVTVANSRPL